MALHEHLVVSLVGDRLPAIDVVVRPHLSVRSAIAFSRKPEGEVQKRLLLLMADS